MSANVIQLERIFRRSWDWSSRELGEFYRVESALIQAGLKIDTERGLSDEGDPWFAFCRPDDGDVIVHIARIGGIYILAGPSYSGIASGTDIAALVRDLVSRHPLIQMRANSPGRSSNIFVHPAALLIAVIATAFFKSTEARALTDEHKPGENRTATALAGAGRSDNISMLETHKTIIMDAVQSAVILSAVASVLQTPSLFASTQELTDAVAPTSDLLDLAAWSATAHHTVFTERAAGFGTHQFEVTHEVHAQAISGIVPISSVHPETADPTHIAMADALPLIATLWDLPTNRADIQILAHHSSDAPAASKAIGPAAVTLQSPQVTFKMALSNDASESLPSVQATKINYSATNGMTETYNVSKPEQLPATLVSALKEATHTIIEGQPTAVSSASFASALFQSVKDHTAGSKLPDMKAVTASALDAPQSQSASTTPGDKPASQPAATASQANDPQSTVSKVADVTALVQNFFEHTPHWSMYNDGDKVVIYNTDALTLVMKSVTFDFADGSALSLVGLPADLPHLLAT